MIWQLQEAKSKFSQLISITLADGPQIVTRHGKKVAVVVPFEQFEAWTDSRPTLIQALLDAPLRGSEIEIPERSRADLGRPPIQF